MQNQPATTSDLISSSPQSVKTPRELLQSASWVDFFDQEGAVPAEFMEFDRDELPQKLTLFDTDMYN